MVAQTAHLRGQTAGAEDLARLVGRRGDHRQTLRDTGRVRSRGGDAAELVAHRDQLGQPVAIDRHRLPLPIAGRRPPVATVVERYVADLTSDRVDEPSHQTVGEKARQEEVLVRPPPHIGLVSTQPVGLGLGLEVPHGLMHPDESERQSPQSAHGFEALGAPLIEPHDRGPQRPAVGIDVDHRGALGGQRDRRHRGPRHVGRRPQPPARRGQRPPRVLGIELRPARIRRHVRLDLHPVATDEATAGIEQQRPHALRAVVDREQVVGAHRDRSAASIVARFSPWLHRLRVRIPLSRRIDATGSP